MYDEAVGRNMYIYIYIHTHAHAHTYICIYVGHIYILEPSLRLLCCLPPFLFLPLCYSLFWHPLLLDFVNMTIPSGLKEFCTFYSIFPLQYVLYLVVCFYPQEFWSYIFLTIFLSKITSASGSSLVISQASDRYSAENCELISPTQRICFCGSHNKQLLFVQNCTLCEVRTKSYAQCDLIVALIVGSIPDQYMGDFVGHTGTGTGFSPQYSGFPLSVSFHQCIMLDFINVFFLAEGQTGQAWETSEKAMLFRKLGSIGTKDTYFTSRGFKPDIVLYFI